MSQVALQLINDVIKPWEELNALLVQRFAFQPDRSDATRLASTLAISLKHQTDLRGEARKAVDSASFENRLMSDVADYAKHGPLHISSRNSKLYVASCFEYNADRGFRFIRNLVTIAHAGTGEHDFMATSLTALHYWMHHIGFSLNRDLAISEGPAEFHPSAYLYFNPKYCIKMKETRLKFVERLSDGTYQPVDPAEVRFEVFEQPPEQ